jgi:hypothetical protein
MQFADQNVRGHGVLELRKRRHDHPAPLGLFAMVREQPDKIDPGSQITAGSLAAQHCAAGTKEILVVV